MYFSLLLTFASVAAALSGFIGVVFVLGRRSEGHLSNRERSALFHLLFSAFSSMFLSLFVASLLAAFPTHEPAVWRVGNGLSAMVHLFGASKGAMDSIRGEMGVESWFRSPTVCIGLATGIVNAVSALGVLPQLSAMAVIFGTVWALIVTALTYTFLLSMGGRSE